MTCSAVKKTSPSPSGAHPLQDFSSALSRPPSCRAPVLRADMAWILLESAEVHTPAFQNLFANVFFAGPMPAAMDGVTHTSKCEDPATPRNPEAPEELRHNIKCGSQVYTLGRGYSVKKMIGQGAFGSVVAGERLGKPVAIKKVLTSQFTCASNLLVPFYGSFAV